MNRGIVKISDLLPVGMLADLHERPSPAPKPAPPRVIGDPTREPVNRQAALITAKASWLHQPMPPEPPPKREIETLREENARLKATNTSIIAENSTLRRRVERLQQQLHANPGKKLPACVPTETKTAATSPKEEILERLNHGS